MEPQVEIYCKKPQKKDCLCLWIILAVIAIILSFFLGALVATLGGIISILSLGAVIVLIIVLTILLIINIIALICCRKNNNKKYCC